MLDEVPYTARVVALLVVAGTAASVDLWRHKDNATRWKEYLFVLGGGLATGAFGMASDLLTSTLSPSYFILGKGLPLDSLPQSAMELGLKAGFSGGAIASAICVWAATRRSSFPQMRLTALALVVWRPFLLAMVLASVFFVSLSGIDPLQFGSRLDSLVSSEELVRFLWVWWIHLGLYTGFLIGSFWSVLAVGRRRRQTAQNLSCESN